MPEAAMQLYVAARDTEGALALLNGHGNAWLAKGLHRMVDGWMRALPQPQDVHRRTAHALWQAQALLPLEPEAAHPLFAAARQGGCAAGDAMQAYAAWSGEVASYVVQWGAVQGLADLVDVLEALHAELGPPQDELAFRTSADALTALMYGRAEDPRIAGGNGYFIAVGDNGTVGVSTDAGLSWDYAQLGAFAGGFAYKAVAYVPASGSRPGRFIAVGNWYDSNGFAHDLITTIDPTVGSVGSSNFLPGIYHQRFQQGSSLAAVHGSGVIVGNGNGGYYTYAGSDVSIAPGGIGYQVTGNRDAGTAAGATIAQTLQTSGFFAGNYGASTRVIQFGGLYWGLTGGTGGLTSSDGVSWPGGNSGSFQIHNPDPARYTTGFVAGPGQMVGVSTDGEFFYNSTGGNTLNSWTDISTCTQLGDAPRLVYGNGRYIAAGTVILKSQ